MQNAAATLESSYYPRATTSFEKQCSSPLHLHRHLEFICILTGAVEMELNGERHTLSNGSAAFVTPYTPHSYSMLTKECDRFVLVFEPEYVGSLGEILLTSRPDNAIIPAEVMHREFPMLAEKLTDISKSIHKGKEDNVAFSNAFAQIVDFINRIIRITKLSDINYDKNERYLRIISRCNNEFSDADFDIHTVAQSEFISASRVQQIFSENMSISFKKYLTLLRISKSKSLLREATESIAGVATASGFNSTRTFNRVFKQQTGVSPLTYRKSFVDND